MTNKKYDIREFNEWLKNQPSDGINWSLSASITNGKIQKYFFSDINNVRECQPNLSWSEECLSVIQKWIKINELENSNNIENFDVNNYDGIIGSSAFGNNCSTEYFKSKDRKTIAYKTICECKREYHQLWKPDTFKCFSCEEIDRLKKKNIELESKLNNKESEKDQIIKNLKKKLAELEINSNENEVVQTEIIETNENSETKEIEIDNHSVNSDDFVSFD